jgi:hypothetical protein
MSATTGDRDPHEVLPDGSIPGIPELEFDEDIAPRPEENIADVARATPDTAEHGDKADLEGRV